MREHHQELVFRAAVMLGTVAVVVGLEELAQICDDQIQPIARRRDCRGKRQAHLEGARLGADQSAALPPTASRQQGLKCRPVGGVDESGHAAADHRLERLPHESREAGVCVQDVAATGEDDGAFLHLFNERAVRLLGAAQRIDLSAVGALDDQGINLALTDRLQHVLGFGQARAQRLGRNVIVA